MLLNKLELVISLYMVSIENPENENSEVAANASLAAT